MSARNPTDFNHFVDLMDIRGGEQITTTVPSQVIDDQTFVFDKAEMVINCPGIFFVEDGGVTQKFILYVDTKDMCGQVDVVNNEISCAVYIQAAGSGTNGEVTITSTAVANNSLVYAFSDPVGDFSYYESAGTLNLKTNGTENTITVSLARTGGGDVACLFGLLIVANET